MAGKRKTGLAGMEASPTTDDVTSRETSNATSDAISDANRETRRLVEALCDPAHHRLGPGPVRVVETHISYVLLTGALAYKIKKPLRLDFLDFSTLERRRRACEDELRLNRRTAPELYLRVVAIAGTSETPCLADPMVGGAIEYAVEMRQFDPDALLAGRVERGTIDGTLVDAFAGRVAAFHAALPPARASTPGAALATARRNLAEILGLPIEPALRGRIEALARWVEGTAPEVESLLGARERAGFVRECHGDLHLANVALIEGRPILFDCLEFDLAMRTIDVIDEVAFGFVDFVAHGRRDLAYRFLNTYLEATGDYAGVAGLRFFALHRALVRAKVSLLRGCQAGLDARTRAHVTDDVERYVAAAESQASPPEARLVITFGLSGSGKTTVSGALVEALGALRIRSDVERKRLAGLAPSARSDSPIGGGLYDREGSARTYAHLEALARTILASGQSVVVDAAFLARSDRDRFRALARAAGVAFAIAVCDAPVEVLRARIAARHAAGRDASEADVAVLEHQLGHHEAPADEERAAVFVFATDRGVEAVREACRTFARD